MSPSPQLDDLGRPVIGEPIKHAIDDAFKDVTGRGALLVIADEHGTRGTWAAKFGDHWKVAGGGGFEWHETKPYGFVAVQAVW